MLDLALRKENMQRNVIQLKCEAIVSSFRWKYVRISLNNSLKKSILLLLYHNNSNNGFKS